MKGNWEWLLMVTVSFEGDENVLKIDYGKMVCTKLHEYAKILWIVYYKWVNYIICELYLIEAVKKSFVEMNQCEKKEFLSQALSSVRPLIYHCIPSIVLLEDNFKMFWEWMNEWMEWMLLLILDIDFHLLIKKNNNIAFVLYLKCSIWWMVVQESLWIISDLLIWCYNLGSKC